jgi:hypothetical protein
MIVIGVSPGSTDTGGSAGSGWGDAVFAGVTVVSDAGGAGGAGATVVSV